MTLNGLFTLNSVFWSSSSSRFIDLLIQIAPWCLWWCY